MDGCVFMQYECVYDSLQPSSPAWDGGPQQYLLWSGSNGKLIITEYTKSTSYFCVLSNPTYFQHLRFEMHVFLLTYIFLFHILESDVIFETNLSLSENHIIVIHEESPGFVWNDVMKQFTGILPFSLWHLQRRSVVIFWTEQWHEWQQEQIKLKS